MIKKIIIVACIIFAFSNCDDPGDCVKSTGPIVAKQFEGLTFTKIIVHKGIALEITQGDAYKVEVKSGENLINDIKVTVAGDMLTIEDNSTCNWVRDYGQTTVYVTAPNLTEIISKTEQEIRSNGVLYYAQLRLASIDANDGFEGAGTGDFIMQLNNASVFVEYNNVSRFYLSGRTGELSANCYTGGGIFYGQDLNADKVRVFHRGSNDMFVHPIDEITGDIYNIGNVFSVIHPPMINVVQHYQGQLLFY